MQSFLFVRLIVIADMRDDATVGGFDRVQLVVLVEVVSGAGRDFGEPAPGLPVIG